MFAEAVRTNRQRLGLTQEELADATGLSARSIRKLESGEIGTPRPATVRQLADAFGLSGPERDRFYAQASGPVRSTPAPRPLPAQLPPDVPAFTGRADELAWLDKLLDASAEPATPPLVAALSGTAGVGKTALATHWAHRAAGRFPDGQLYVNLRGYDPEQPVPVTDVLAKLLSALGVPGPDIPLEPEERAARYRGELAGRRMLIVLDNAATVEQVRPLLPGTGSCAVLVTSRDRLGGLVAVHGADRLDLNRLPISNAVALLRRLIGARAGAEPAATAALAELCARLPLALRIAAELAITHADTALSDLVTELGDEQKRLELLDAGDPRAAVKAVFSWSVQRLAAPTARMFRLLGLHSGPEFDAYAAAALAGLDIAEARHALSRLARAHLVHHTGLGRYGMHDLLRAYAAHLAATTEHTSDRQAALSRLYDYYLAVAATAVDRLYPEGRARPPIPPVPGDLRRALSTKDALAWLDTELPCLVSMAQATADGWSSHTIRLAQVLYRYLDGGHYFDALAIHGHAHLAARQENDIREQARALCNQGDTYGRMGRYGPAADHLQRALDLFQKVGDRAGEALALINLGNVSERLGRYQTAADHVQRALALFQEAGEEAGEASALNNLGIVELRLGRYEAAVEHCQRALAKHRRLGNLRGEAHALNNLAIVEERTGHYAAAAGHLRQALTLIRTVGHVVGEAHMLDSLGILHSRLGQPDQALGYFQQALTLLRQVGDRAGEVMALNGLGEAAEAAGDHAGAIRQHTAALDLAAEIGTRDQQARAHAGLGSAHRATGDPAQARIHYESALALFTDLDMPEADRVRAGLSALGDGAPA